MTPTIVVLGTGGTIAGTAPPGAADSAYTAAQLGVKSLVDAVPSLAAHTLECEQVAQIDSKDMGFAVWRLLAHRVAYHLAREEVGGAVITHGTDTLEETAYFLHRVLAPAKPVVMTAAMRPASSLQADGPQNLSDAVWLAEQPGVRGVMVAMNSRLHGPEDVHKAHTQRLDAFSSGDAGALAAIEDHRLIQWRAWPQGEALGLDRLPADDEGWPRVEIVTSHAGADGSLVRALVPLGVQGIVVAATGHGTVHHRLEEALLEAQARGVVVWRSSRCGDGRVHQRPADVLASAGALNPAKARVELILRLLRPPSA